MTRYALRRLLGAVPLILGIITVVFFVVNLAPGDPSLLYLNRNMSPESLEQVRRSMGLTDPVLIRYVKWLAGVLQGDFQYSLTMDRPALDVVLERLPNTILLAATAIGGAFVVGILVGVLQAVRQRSLVDSFLSVVTLVFYSMPSFWLAIMMVLTFSLFARNVWDWPIWFPASGVRSPDYEFLTGFEKVIDTARHLFLPATTLALVLAGGVARYVRSSMLEVIHQDFVRTARAKGLPERTVISKHVLRNALLPVITLLGLYLPFIFSGAVLVETVFAWPGMGLLTVEAIGRRDYPVVMAASLIFAVMVVLGNLIADLLYGLADPRIRYD
ncbi:MAG: ABC transporter permease [Longimicrobiales bacterium]